MMVSVGTPLTKSKKILLILNANKQFDEMCNYIKNHFDSQYLIYIEHAASNPDYRRKYGKMEFDLVFKFWYTYERIDPFVVYPHSKKVLYLYDWTFWNRDANKQLHPNLLQKMINNLKTCDHIMCSSFAIRDNLCKQYVGVVPVQKLYTIFPGVNVKQYGFQPYPLNKNLVVGWVGNVTNIQKKFYLLKSIMKSATWIDFRPVNTLDAVGQNMVNYYHSIDVMVCISDDEETCSQILEAGSCGRTFVSKDVGILRLLFDGVGLEEKPGLKPGIIIKSHIELLTKLKFLHLNRPIMQQMGQCAHNILQQNFTWEKQMDQFQSIFHLMDTVPNTQTKIIIASTQYPRYGGAATSAYEMHRYLLKNGMQSVCIFFDNSIKKNLSMLNPDKLFGVLEAPLIKDKNYERYVSTKESVSQIYGPEPYVIYAFNYLAPILSKKIFPKSKVYYMTTGCLHIHNKNLVNATSILRSETFGTTTEDETIQISDGVVANSQLSKNLLEHIYHAQFDNFVDLHEIFTLSAPKDMPRIYDICFICSNFNRKVKNVDLVKEIFNSDPMKKYQKICIGKDSMKYISTKESVNITYKDFINQSEIISILSQTKIVLVPSYMESYSITAIEATQCGCLVLSTPNAACTSTMHPYFVINSYLAKDWIQKINGILQNYSYCQKIFYNAYDSTPPITELFSQKLEPVKKPINIIFGSVDIPYVGGAGTNLYRLIKAFGKDPGFNVWGIFFSNHQGDYNPDNLPNIRKLSIDDATEHLLETIRDQLEPIDIIFCKNYKIIPFFKKVFPRVQIVFSPSGLRYISSITNDNYISDIKMCNVKKEIAKHRITTIGNNIYDFVKNNDKYLDDYAITQSDLIIPNSFLTYNLIKNIYGRRLNLDRHLQITNIVCTHTPPLDPVPTPDSLAIPDPNFIQRPSDVLFCCYCWKRPCKNYKLVSEISNDESLKNKKIIIVGKNQTKLNVTSHDYLSNDSLMELLKTVKVVVIPSKYDSCPNVLVEAINCGCNVVTSCNVGGHEDLDPECLVKKYSEKKDWVDTIMKCLDKKYYYKGPPSNLIYSDLKKRFQSMTQRKKSVSVYKIPPELDHQMVSPLACFAYTEVFDYIEAFDDKLVSNLVNYDIYFNMYVEISKREECTDVNYIIYDSTIVRNMVIFVSKVFPTYANYIKIWKMKDIRSVMHFNDAKVYFMRGTYFKFFNALIPPESKKILYPATSIQQKLSPSSLHFTNESCKFDIILVHEDPLYKEIYKWSKCVIFNKFATDNFVYTNDKREFDLCFVATEKQITKNHHLFVAFIKYLDLKGIKSKVVFVGDLQKVLNLHKIEKFNLKCVKITNYAFCEKEELVKVFNKCRINILFSGRDAYPRVISESAACGCFNIALDTLSDGKNFYDGVLGALVGDPGIAKKISNSSSLCYEPNPKLWDQVIQYLNMTFDHENISVQFKKKYNMRNVMEEIYK